jgi:hypothetical protein
MENRNIHILLTNHKFPVVDKRCQNIYITSNESAKHAEWCFYEKDKECPVKFQRGEYLNAKKIILTTDPKLIADGVQAIDEEFLEWFVKNSSCEYVEVRKTWEFLGDDYRRGGERTLVYKIIIPNEKPLLDKAGEKFLESTDMTISVVRPKPGNFYEDLVKYFETTPREKVLEDWNKSAHLNNVGPTVDEFLENTNKQQETLEEDLKFPIIIENGLDYLNLTTKIFNNGAKWQQEQDKNKYSEEDILDAWELGAKEGLQLTREKKEKLFKYLKKK